MTEIPMLLEMLPAFSPLLALWHSAGAGSDASILWMQQAICVAAAVLVALAIIDYGEIRRCGFTP